MITLKDTRARYSDAWNRIEQVGRKQLFVLSKPVVPMVHDALLVSYSTPVAYRIDSVWHVTRTRHSVTTSKQLSQFLRGRTWEYTDNI